MKAEDILDDVVTTVTGLTTTGANVKRARVYPWQASELPALSVYMGSDEYLQELMTGKIDWQLTIIVESHVQATSNIDQTLNTIRGEVYAAIMADRTLGSTSINVLPQNASEPELSGEGDQPTASQRMEYIVHYRTTVPSLD